MNVVFADAFYVVAWLNRRDQHHQRVLEFSRIFRARLLTSDWGPFGVFDPLAVVTASRSCCALNGHQPPSATHAP